MISSSYFRIATLLLVLPLTMAAKCDPRPKEAPAAVTVQLGNATMEVGTKFAATLTEEAVIPRFLAQQKARRTGQVRPVPTTTTTEAKFEAELLAEQPASWRITIASFTRTSQTEGAHKVATMVVPNDTTFEVTLASPATVTAGDGAEVGESAHIALLAIARTLEERQAWQVFASSRTFEQGQIIAASKVFVGNFAEPSFGAISDPNMTVSFYRLDEDGSGEAVLFEAHQSFRAKHLGVEDGSYTEFETTGQIRARQQDGRLLGYELGGKAIPRAATGEMLAEGSGQWSVKFAIAPDAVAAP